MPSVIIGNPVLSGPQIVVSGYPWSGVAPTVPVGEIRFKLSFDASGRIYLGLSGGMTLLSGGMFLSGGGLADGFQLGPNDTYTVPRMATGLSGNISVYARHDVACSGQARLFWEAY